MFLYILIRFDRFWCSSGGDVMLLDVAENRNLMYEETSKCVKNDKKHQKRSAKLGAPLEFFFALADRFGGASEKTLKNGDTTSAKATENVRNRFLPRP